MNLKEHTKFHFRHENPRRFTQGRWVKEDHVSILYLLYKIAISIFFFVGWILTVYENKTAQDWKYYWIYLTNWSFVLMIISYIYNTVLVSVRFVKEHRGSPKVFNRWYERDHVSTMISWALSSVANSIAICVTVIFWVALYHKGDDADWSALEKFNNFDVHLLQTVISLIDVPLSSRPWRYAHIYIGFIYGFTYLGFQLIYILGFDGTDSGGNEWIYPILDWKEEPGIAVGWSVAFIVLMLISHGGLCLLAWARDKLWEKIIGPPKKDNRILGVDNPAFSQNTTRNYDSIEH